MTTRAHMDPEFLPPARKERVDDLPLFTGPKTANYSADLDALRLKDNLVRVLRLMIDGTWHSMSELRSVGGSSGDRRLRELRQLGFKIEKERDPHAPRASGVYRYRLPPTFTAETWRHTIERLSRRPVTHSHTDEAA